MLHSTRLRGGREVNVKENLAMKHLRYLFLLTLRLTETCICRYCHALCMKGYWSLIDRTHSFGCVVAEHKGDNVCQQDARSVAAG